MAVAGPYFVGVFVCYRSAHAHICGSESWCEKYVICPDCGSAGENFKMVITFGGLVDAD